MGAAVSGRRFRAFVVVALSCVILAGCTSNERAYRFQKAVESYNKQIRWGNFMGALAMVHESARPDPQRMRFLLNRYEQVQVTGYATIGRRATPNTNDFIEVMELRIVNRHTQRERVIQDEQVWRYFEEEGVWWQMSGLPDISRQ